MQTRKNKGIFKVNKAAFKGLTKLATKSVKQIVKKEIKEESEPKHFEFNETKNQAVSVTAPVQSLISGLPQGIVDSNRIGDKVKIRHINIRMTLDNFANTVTQSDNADNITWRVMVVQDRSYNVVPTLAKLDLTQLLVNGPYGTGGPETLSQRNVDHFNTYVALYDKMFTTELLCKSRISLDINVPLKWCKREIQFSNASSVTNLTNGIFVVVLCSADGAIVPTLPIINYQSRILFSDS